MNQVQTYRPPVCTKHGPKQVWISPSTNHVVKNAKEIENWGADILRIFNREISFDLSKLNQDKKQIVQYNIEQKIPKHQYRHDISRIDKRRNFLWTLQNRALKVIDQQKREERQEDRKRYVVCLREACEELLSPEKYETICKLALTKYDERNSSS